MVPLPCPAGRQCHLLVLLFLFFPGLTCALLGQIYKPSDPFTMWDTWLYQDENTYHLFFLQSEPELIWNTIGRADPTDLLHWQLLPAISAKGVHGSWDENPTLTGMTIKVENGSKSWIHLEMASG